jgi:cytochrome c oxidase subunit 2
MNIKPAHRLSLREVLISVVLLVSSHISHAAEGDKLYRSQCASCHGVNGAGNATLKAPPLAGADQDYLVRQLRNFRSQVRGGEAPLGGAATMQAMAKAISDDVSVLALGRYIGSLKPIQVKAEPTLPGSPLNAGKAVFAVCIACHGSRGEGAPALKAPAIAHLPSWYITGQLQAFRDGLRGANAEDAAGQQMRQIVTELQLDDDVLRALSDYIASLGVKKR